MISDIQSVEQCYCAECLVNKEAGHLMYAQDWVCLVSHPSIQAAPLEIQGTLVNSYCGAFPYATFATFIQYICLS